MTQQHFLRLLATFALMAGSYAQTVPPARAVAQAPGKP